MITLETNCLYICRNQTVVRTAMSALADGRHVTARTAAGIEFTYHMDTGLVCNVPGPDPLDIVAEFFPRTAQPPFPPDTLMIARLTPKGPIVSMRALQFVQRIDILYSPGRSAPLELMDGIPMLDRQYIVEKGKWYVQRGGGVVCARAAGDNGRVPLHGDITVDQHTGTVGHYASSPYDLVAEALESVIPQTASPMPPPPPAPPWPLPAGHKHAALMLEYAQDAAKTPTPWLGWQICDIHGEFCDLKDNPSWATNVSYRRKPYEITVGDVTIDGPLREAPAVGTEVYCVQFVLDDGVDTLTWQNQPSHQRLLAQGLLFDTADRAKACSAALLRVLHV